MVTSVPKPRRGAHAEDGCPQDGNHGAALTVKIVVAAAIVAVLASAVLAIAAAHRSSLLY